MPRGAIGEGHRGCVFPARSSLDWSTPDPGTVSILSLSVIATHLASTCRRARYMYARRWCLARRRRLASSWCPRTTMSTTTSSLSTSTISFAVHPGFTSYGRYGRTAPLGVRGGVGLHTVGSSPPPFSQPPSCGRHHSQPVLMGQGLSSVCVGSTRATQFGRLLRFRAWCGTAPIRDPQTRRTRPG